MKVNVTHEPEELCTSCRLRGSRILRQISSDLSDRENEAGINGSYFIYIRELNLLFSLGAIAAGSFSEYIECRMSRHVREYESAGEVSAREATEAVTL